MFYVQSRQLIALLSLAETEELRYESALSSRFLGRGMCFWGSSSFFLMAQPQFIYSYLFSVQCEFYLFI